MNLTIIRSSRKTIAMRITGPDAIEIRAPWIMPQAQINDFVNKAKEKTATVVEAQAE